MKISALIFVVWLEILLNAHGATGVGQRSGTVIAWGRDYLGVLTIPEGLTDVIAVDAGSYHALALRRDGTVVAWGWGEHGQTAVPPGLNEVIAVSAGTLHNLALRSDGSVVGWGASEFSETKAPAGLGRVMAVAAGNGFSVALRQDKTVVAWGRNDHGQTTVPPDLGDVVAIAAGDAHALALTSDGRVVGWGLNINGQAGVPSGLGVAKAIAASTLRSAALRNDGTVITWGGLGSAIAELPPPRTLPSANLLTLGHSFAAVALSGGRNLMAWGKNDFGEINTPSEITGVFALSAGLYFTVALYGPEPVSHAATATAQIVNGFVVGISIRDGGYGYTNAPVIKIVGGGGAGATATALVTDGVVTSIVVDNAGRGYASAPVIKIASPARPPEVGLRVVRMAVDMKVVLGGRYQLLVSDDLNDWHQSGIPFIAEEELITQEFDVSSAGRFFRLIQLE